MGFWRGLGKVAGSVVDIRVDKWTSYSYLKDSSKNIKGIATDLFTIKTAARTETFEEAVIRMHLTEDDLVRRKKEFLSIAFLFVFLALGLLFYGLYWAMNLIISATLISFCLCAFCLSQAFRFHFWYFQVKNRKLGCTVQEWFNSKLASSPPQ